MILNSTPLCEICHKPRSMKIHQKCSKIKQANSLLENKPKRKTQTYDSNRKLTGFLKVLGQ